MRIEHREGLRAGTECRILSLELLLVKRWLDVLIDRLGDPHEIALPYGYFIMFAGICQFPLDARVSFPVFCARKEVVGIDGGCFGDEFHGGIGDLRKLAHIRGEFRENRWPSSIFRRGLFDFPLEGFNHPIERSDRRSAIDGASEVIEQRPRTAFLPELAPKLLRKRHSKHPRTRRLDYVVQFAEL